MQRAEKQMNAACGDEKNIKGPPLPADIVNDLQEGFNFYDKE